MTATEVIESLYGAQLYWEKEAFIEQLQCSICFIEQYEFCPGGCVVASIGQKNAVCGPALKYRIVDENTVEMESVERGKVHRWEQLKIDGDLLIVTCDAYPKTFKITRRTTALPSPASSSR